MKDIAEPRRRLLTTAGLAGAGLLFASATCGMAAEGKGPGQQKKVGAAATYIPVLEAQHQRGREITDHILAVTGKGAIGAAHVEPLARAFETFVPMLSIGSSGRVRPV